MFSVSHAYKEIPVSYSLMSLNIYCLFVEKIHLKYDVNVCMSFLGDHTTHHYHNRICNFKISGLKIILALHENNFAQKLKRNLTNN